ncbi:hypothetical protein ACVWY5_006817 [Bradyrhizobium sp. USDA 3256]
MDDRSKLWRTSRGIGRERGNSSAVLSGSVHREIGSGKLSCQRSQEESDSLYSTRWPARQPISQKSASSRVASLKIAISSVSRAGVA